MLPPLDKLTPHSYNILPPSAAQLLPHFTPLHKLAPYFYSILPSLAARLLHNFTPSEQINPSLLQNFTPLVNPTLTSLNPL